MVCLCAWLASPVQLAAAVNVLRLREAHRQSGLDVSLLFGPGPAPANALAPGPAPAPASAPGSSWDSIFPDTPGGGGLSNESQPNGTLALGPAAPDFSHPLCGVEAAGPVCFGDEITGAQIVLSAAVSADLRGFWSFDQASVNDQSGNKNHGYGGVAVGPAFGGQGSSAFFHQSFLEVPDTGGALNLADFTYTFWVYLIEEGAGTGLQMCPIVRKGLGGGERFAGDLGREYDAAPAVMYDRFTRRLRIEIITLGAPGSTPGVPLLEAFESNARLRPSRWFHVAVTRADADKRTRLYVNGILDASHASRGNVKPVQEPLFVGGDPLTRDKCNMPLYIDELRVYSRVLDEDEIQAEASPALAGIEPSFVRLACVDCPVELAERLCPSDYHICSSLEMHMGGYQVAHSMGYLLSGTHVWTRSAVEAARKQRAAARKEEKKTKGAPEEAGGIVVDDASPESGGIVVDPESGGTVVDGGSSETGGKTVGGGPSQEGGSTNFAGGPEHSWDVVRGQVVSLVQQNSPPEATSAEKALEPAQVLALPRAEQVPALPHHQSEQVLALPHAEEVALGGIPRLGLGLCCSDFN